MYNKSSFLTDFIIESNIKSHILVVSFVSEF